MKKIKVAIIGCGLIAESHAKTLIADGRAEIVAAAYGRNIQKGRAFADKYNIPKIVGDYHELLNDEIDMICICTPSGMHAECAIDFANAGVSVLCEKPLDVTHEKMTAMIDACAKNGVKLGCVFPNRTRAGIERAKKLLDSGELGKMKIVECQYRGYRSHAYYNNSTWRNTKAQGGGCFMNQGIHAIDLMMYLTGDVARVCAITGTLGRDIEAEDAGVSLLEFANGAQGVLMATTLSYIPEHGPEGDRIRIECERGSILYADGNTTYFKNNSEDDFDVEEISLDEKVSHEIAGIRPDDIDMVGHQKIVSNFISTLLGEAEVMIPPESARRGADLIDSIYESSAKRCWVDVRYE